MAGGGPQGGTIGLLEYLAQSNDCADFADVKDRFRFLDDLSLLEIVNLLSVGLASHNVSRQIPSNIASHNQFIAPENLKSQDWLNRLNQWTKASKMKINETKTKTMIFNYSKKYQFTTELKIEDEPIEVIDQTRLLGTIITSDLKWDANCKNIIKKVNARMALLRKVSKFGAGIEDLKTIYILFIRSLLEQSATVWHSSLTNDNTKDLERVQKTALRIILGNRYKSYTNALNILNLQSLSDRRRSLCLNFAKKSAIHPKFKHNFPLNEKSHRMKLRKIEKFKVFRAFSARFRKSSIIYMQKLLNQ